MTLGPTRCLVCDRPAPLVSPYPRCECGGNLALPEVRDPGAPARSGVHGLTLWRYHAAFPFASQLRSLTLGEAPVALEPITLPGLARPIWALRDDLLPTGSWKDRGSLWLIAALRACGVTDAIEDSSGNAGLSLARYAEAARISFTTFVPASASVAKQTLIKACGAQLIEVAGPRIEATLAAERAAKQGRFWASHALQPIHAAGAASAAFEIVEALGRVPDAVILPAGQGGYIAGVFAGFAAMAHSRGTKLPRMIGVQTVGCAPLAQAFARGATYATRQLDARPSLAEGVQIAAPQRDREALHAVRQSHGSIVTTSELSIDRAVRCLWREGVRVEPTAAVSVAWLLETEGRLLHECESVVVLLSGHGVRNGLSLVEGL
jgi:threonine synthase